MVLLVTTGLTTAVVATPAQAQDAARNFDIPAQPLAAALTTFGRQSGLQVSVPAPLVEGRSSSAVRGQLNAAQALSQLLAGTGLTFRISGRTVTLELAPVTSGDAIQLGPVRVEENAQGSVSGSPAGQVAVVQPAYAGGQIARGARVGILGNRDYMDTPYSVSSYTDQALRDVAARTRLDVLELDPSVIRARGALQAQDQFLVRGFNSFGFEGLVDGLSGLVGTTGRDTELYERIELTKGPSALLNGANVFNIGGTVNLVTKYARDEPITQLNLRYSESSEITSHIDFGRRFGPDGAFGVRANIVYADGDRNTVDAGVSPRFRRQLYSIALDYRGERVRAFAHAYRLDDDQSVAANLYGLSLDQPDPTRPPPRPSIGIRNSGIYRDVEALSARVEWDPFANTTVTLNYGESKSVTVQPFASVTDLDPVTGDATVQNGLYAEGGGNYQMLATLNTSFSTGPITHRLGMDINRSWSKVPGGDGFVFEFAEPFQTNVFRQVRGPTLPFSLARNLTFNGKSPAEYTYGIADTLGFFEDRLQLTVGARRVESIDDVTPSVAVLFAVTPQISVYGNYIEGVQGRVTAPFNNSPRPEDQIVNPGEIFPPTPTEQHEIGAKLDFGNLGVTAALFEIERISYYVDPATRRFGPLGLQRNRGLELNVFGEPIEGLRIIGGFAYIDALLARTENPLVQGNTAAGVPRYTFTLFANYALPWVPGLGVSFQARTQSKQFVDETNAQQVSGFTILSGGLTYATTALGPPVIFRARVENLANKRYYTSFGRGVTEDGGPRTFSLSAQIDF